MNFCETHLERLETEVKDRGLGALISDDIETMKMKLIDLIEKGVNLDNFDPICVTFQIIIQNSLRVAYDTGGRAASYELSNGGPTQGTEWCPICYLTTVHDALCDADDCPEDFERWIPQAADGALRIWKRLNLASSRPPSLVSRTGWSGPSLEIAQRRVFKERRGSRCRRRKCGFKEKR